MYKDERMAIRGFKDEGTQDIAAEQSNRCRLAKRFLPAWSAICAAAYRKLTPSSTTPGFLYGSVNWKSLVTNYVGQRTNWSIQHSH